MDKVHMEIEKNVYGLGWTKCRRGQDCLRTNNWKGVTCKDCLKRNKEE